MTEDELIDLSEKLSAKDLEVIYDNLSKTVKKDFKKILFGSFDSDDAFEIVEELNEVELEYFQESYLQKIYFENGVHTVIPKNLNETIEVEEFLKRF